MQIARVMAEKVDKDLIAEINTVGNYVQGYTAADANGKMTISVLMEGKLTGFGDRADESTVCFMHSLNYLTMMKDTNAGFLKADANDPWFNVPGFKGRIGGMALVVADTCPAHAAVGGKKTYECFICKPNAYGFMVAEVPDMEYDYDILHREHVFAGTQWYGVKAFHAKIATDDLRICRLSVATEVAA